MYSRILVLFWIFVTCKAIFDRFDCSLPPPDVFVENCCNYPSMYDENIYKQCWKNWSTPGVLNPIIGGGISGGAGGCVAECFFNKTKIFNGDSINLNELTHMVAKNVPFNNIYFDVVMSALEKCVDQANLRRPRFLLIKNSDNVVKNRPNCNPISGYTLTCIASHILTNCPRSQLRFGWRCEELIGYFNYCSSPV